jgi:hypothetical protein
MDTILPTETIDSSKLLNSVPVQPETSQIPPSETVTVTPVSTQPPPQPNFDIPKKPKLTFKKILLIAILLIFGGLAFLFFQGVKEAPQVKAKVTNFMQLVSTNDFNSAYAQTSSLFKETISMNDFVNTMITFKAQYSGFKEQSQTGFSVEAKAGKPTQYKYSGVITYDDGDKGEVQAVLVKENGDWKFNSVKVNIDVKRIQKFQQQNKESVLGVSISE